MALSTNIIPDSVSQPYQLFMKFCKVCILFHLTQKYWVGGKINEWDPKDAKEKTLLKQRISSFIEERYSFSRKE